MAYCARCVPKFHPISISGYHMQVRRACGGGGGGHRPSGTGTGQAPVWRVGGARWWLVRSALVVAHRLAASNAVPHAIHRKREQQPPSSLLSPLPTGWSTFAALRWACAARLLSHVLEQPGWQAACTQPWRSPRAMGPQPGYAPAEGACLTPASTAPARLQAAGLQVDQIAPRLSFFFAIGMNFYEVGWRAAMHAAACAATYHRTCW